MINHPGALLARLIRFIISGFLIQRRLSVQFLSIGNTFFEQYLWRHSSRAQDSPTLRTNSGNFPIPSARFLTGKSPTLESFFVSKVTIHAMTVG